MGKNFLKADNIRVFTGDGMQDPFLSAGEIVDSVSAAVIADVEGCQFHDILPYFVIYGYYIPEKGECQLIYDLTFIVGCGNFIKDYYGLLCVLVERPSHGIY